MMPLFKSTFYTYSYGDSIVHFIFEKISIYNRHFLPYRRADLTQSTSLQGICSRVYSFIPFASYLR